MPLAEKHLHEWDSKKVPLAESICMNGAANGGIGRKAFA